MGELWLAFLLKCVSPRWIKRLFFAVTILYALYIIGWVVFLYEWSQIRW
jgi:hypothetical protein